MQTVQDYCVSLAIKRIETMLHACLYPLSVTDAPTSRHIHCLKGPRLLSLIPNTGLPLWYSHVPADNLSRVLQLCLNEADLLWHSSGRKMLAKEKKLTRATLSAGKEASTDHMIDT